MLTSLEMFEQSWDSGVCLLYMFGAGSLNEEKRMNQFEFYVENEDGEL